MLLKIGQWGDNRSYRITGYFVFSIEQLRGFPFILLFIAVSAGYLVTGIRKEANRKQSEKAWEPVAEISGSCAGVGSFNAVHV